MPEIAARHHPGPPEGPWTSPLAYALYREFSAAPGNLFFSPYSILGALMAARSGAAGATAREIDGVLGRPEEGEALSESFGSLLRTVGRVARPGSGLFELVTANALWCQTGWPVRAAYIEALRARLGAEVGAVDFEGSAERAARTVNAWVAEVTRGRLSAIVGQDQIHPGIRSLLANTAYFKAPWCEAFEAAATRHEPFSLPRGQRVDVPMMHRTGCYHYGHIGHAQALQLPYVIWPIRMILLLPDEGDLSAIERDLRPGFLRRLIRESEVRETRLSLPRCRVHSSLRLRGPLAKLGIVSAFERDADFSGISERKGLFLHDVLHRTFVDVNEYGAEASASAFTTLARRRLRGAGHVEFRVDRPFLVLICDTDTGTVFFMGRIVDPRG